MSADAADGLGPLAGEESRRVAHLFDCRGWPRPLEWGDRRRARKAEVGWSSDLGDPELTKNLRTYLRLIDGADGVIARGSPRLTSEEVTERLIPRDAGVPLTIESLLGRRFDLERLLVEKGDPVYVRERAAELFEEEEGTVRTWKQLFPGEPLPEPTPTGSDVVPTRRRLGRVLAAKEALDLPLRARRQLKSRALLLLVLPLLVVAAALFGLAIAKVVGGGDGALLLAAAAGATGACLGGLFRLRDTVRRGAQVREFGPFFVGQIVVGAVAGLLAFVVDDAEAVEIGGGDAGLAAFSFALGYSEAVLIGLIAKLGGQEKAGEEASPPPGTSAG